MVTQDMESGLTNQERFASKANAYCENFIAMKKAQLVAQEAARQVELLQAAGKALGLSLCEFVSETQTSRASTGGDGYIVVVEFGVNSQHKIKTYGSNGSLIP